MDLGCRLAEDPAKIWPNSCTSVWGAPHTCVRADMQFAQTEIPIWKHRKCDSEDSTQVKQWGLSQRIKVWWMPGCGAKCTYPPCVSLSPQRNSLLWMPEPQDLEHWKRVQAGGTVFRTWTPQVCVGDVEASCSCRHNELTYDSNRAESAMISQDCFSLYIQYVTWYVPSLFWRFIWTIFRDNGSMQQKQLLNPRWLLWTKHQNSFRCVSLSGQRHSKTQSAQARPQDSITRILFFFFI